MVEAEKREQSRLSSHAQLLEGGSEEQVIMDNKSRLSKNRK